LVVVVVVVAGREGWKSGLFGGGRIRGLKGSLPRVFPFCRNFDLLVFVNRF
jgi:hypothetical protein